MEVCKIGWTIFGYRRIFSFVRNKQIITCIDVISVVNALDEFFFDEMWLFKWYLVNNVFIYEYLEHNIDDNPAFSLIVLFSSKTTSLNLVELV